MELKMDCSACLIICFAKGEKKSFHLGFMKMKSKNMFGVL